MTAQIRQLIVYALCVCDLDPFGPSSPLFAPFCALTRSIRAIEESTAEALKSGGTFGGAFCGVKAISSTEWQAKVANLLIIEYLVRFYNRVAFVVTMYSSSQ